MIQDHHPNTLSNETVEKNMEVVVRDGLFHPPPFEGATGYVAVVIETAPGYPSAVGVRLYHHIHAGLVYYKPYELREIPT